jgi:hypothetical protein
VWTLGRDADALEELWRRRGLWPVATVDEATADAVVGYLWWRYRLTAARDELFRRYHRHAATDWGQTAAVKLLETCDRWDYLNYPDLRRLLGTSLGRAAIDLGTARNRQPFPGSDLGEVTSPLDDRAPPPEAAVDARDSLEAAVPLELRAIAKLKFNSAESPLELTADEMSYLVTRDWQHAHPGTDPPGRWARQERDDIETWMANHPKPTGEEVRARFPWYNPVKAGQALRTWRLRRHADRNSELLGRLLAGAGDETEALAFRLQDGMDELTGRVAGAVPAFAALEETAAALGPLLRANPRGDDAADALAEWQANLADFAAAFRALAKGAACWRLARRLADKGLPPSADGPLRQLGAWLEKRPWLATSSTEDKDAARAHAERLAGTRADLDGDRRAALELLLLRLRAVSEVDPPPPWLCELDRAWWQGHEPGHAWPPAVPDGANALVVACAAADWPEAARQVVALCDRLSGPAAEDLRDGLRRLSRVLPR